MSGRLPEISLVHLITNPQPFDGVDVNIIALIGVVQGKEALFLHRLDYENAVLANSVGLELTEKMRGRIKPPCYVELEGMFISDPDASTGQVGKLQVTQIASWFLAKDPKECRQ